MRQTNGAYGYSPSAGRMPTERASFADRRARAAAELRERGLAALLASPGADLFYLSGYQLFTSERLTCLVLGRDGTATMVCPELEAPRAAAAAPDLERATWGETDDPYALVARLVSAGGGIAVADQMWAAFVLRLESTLPKRAFSVASEITREMRMRKDAIERDALRLVAESADRAYARMLGRPFAGRTEREVGAELASLLRDEGHEEVGFTIVASGPNGASPHHEAGDRRIVEGDTVVLDFGGARRGYRSDITRTVHVGTTIESERQRVHDVVRRAQEAGYAAAHKGASAESVALGAGFFAGRRGWLAGALSVLLGGALFGVVTLIGPSAAGETPLDMLQSETALVLAVVPYAIGGTLAGAAGEWLRSRALGRR